jgi:hypothetical protein
MDSNSNSNSNTTSDSNSNSNSLSSPPDWNLITPSRTEAVSTAGRQHAERQTSDSGPTSRAAVAVACIGCRTRHLKCDGQNPCGRCGSESIPCSYVKSRRGWKGPKKNGTASLSPVGIVASKCIRSLPSIPHDVIVATTTSMYLSLDWIPSFY